jgi:hypothetical protein
MGFTMARPDCVTRRSPPWPVTLAGTLAWWSAHRVPDQGARPGNRPARPSVPWRDHDGTRSHPTDEECLS